MRFWHHSLKVSHAENLRMRLERCSAQSEGAYVNMNEVALALARVVVAVIAVAGSAFGDWQGTFDGRWDPGRIQTSGDNVLIVERAYVWDNGEGKSPTGEGSDWAWYGVKHGPDGNLHLKVYSPDGKFLLRDTMLHGAWETGDRKWEWKDDEGLEYIYYGIYDWDDFGYDAVQIEIYESDPGPFRSHDYLMTLHVDRQRSYCGVGYSSYHMPILDLRTVDLSGSKRWDTERRLLVSNNTGRAINVYVISYTLLSTGGKDWTRVIGPFHFIAGDSRATFLWDSDSNWEVTGDWVYIWAESSDGQYVWNKYRENALFIAKECPTPELENYSLSFDR